MQKTRVLWLPQARNDLREIRRRIATNAPRSAARFVRRLKASVDRLKLFPQSGWVVEEQEDPQIREIVYGPYRIVYRLRERLAEILTVHHGARLFRHEPRKSE